MPGWIGTQQGEGQGDSRSRLALRQGQRLAQGRRNGRISPLARRRQDVDRRGGAAAMEIHASSTRERSGSGASAKGRSSALPTAIWWPRCGPTCRRSTSTAPTTTAWKGLRSPIPRRRQDVVGDAVPLPGRAASCQPAAAAQRRPGVHACRARRHSGRQLGEPPPRLRRPGSHDHGKTWDLDRRFELDRFDFLRKDGYWVDGMCGHIGAVALPDGSVISAYGHYQLGAAVLVKWKPDAETRCSRFPGSASRSVRSRMRWSVMRPANWPAICGSCFRSTASLPRNRRKRRT